MKSRLFLTLLTLGALAAALLAPGGTRAASEPADERATAALIQDVMAQQKAITDNQAKIDGMLAALGEQLRLARIFESRAGGGHR